MKAVVIAMTINLTHQHSKVRKAQLKVITKINISQSLKDVILAHKAEDFLEETFPQLKLSINDRSQDVRKEFFLMVKEWLKQLEFNALKKYEKTLIQFLLNGIADLNTDVQATCIELLDAHGKEMRVGKVFYSLGNPVQIWRD